MKIANFVIAVLSLFSVAIISFTFFLDIDSEILRLLEYYDIILCLFFFVDFIKQLISAEKKWRYFYTFGWIDLLSSIPMINEFRYARVLRIFRVIRVIKSIKLLGSFLVNNKRHTLFGAVVLLIVLSIFVCTLFVLQVEKQVGNIQTAEDALWWAFITLTTVGYGDYYPITNEGKIIASFLIINGLVGFGTFLSYLNSQLNNLNNHKL